jgi:MFS family permease
MSCRAKLFTPVLLIGCFIILVSFSIRASFGLFQIPISAEFGWPRAEFSLAIAIQNLAWGIGQPIFSAIAEKIGDRKAIIMGGLVYAVGLILSSAAVSPEAHQTYEILIGFGIAGTGFGVILAAVGRASSDKNRTMSLAIATAAGSGGQIFGPLLADWLLSFASWQSVFLIFAAMIISSLFTLPFMKVTQNINRQEAEQSMTEILRKAFKDPSFAMLFLGFFSCGYQLAFMTAHFPALVTEMCGPILSGGILNSIGITTTSALGAAALAVIGVTNIAGTLGAGYLGSRYPKKYLLCGVYTGRTIIATAFIMTPITPETVLLFSMFMGALWLATVPLTSGLVGHIYGLRYMGTLYGVVFFSHQLGGFLGVWLGGRLYDIYGNYEAVWWVGIAVGAFSALIHLPIREKSIALAA